MEELKRLESERKKQLKIVDIERADLQQFVKVVPDWSKEFMDANTSTKKMLLASIIDKIIVKNDDITIKFKISLNNFKIDTDSTSHILSSEKNGQIESGVGEPLPEKVHQPTTPYILCLK